MSNGKIADPANGEIPGGNATATRSDTMGDFVLRLLWTFSYTILVGAFQLLRRVETVRISKANKPTGHVQ